MRIDNLEWDAAHQLTFGENLRGSLDGAETQRKTSLAGKEPSLPLPVKKDSAPDVVVSPAQNLSDRAEAAGLVWALKQLDKYTK